MTKESLIEMGLSEEQAAKVMESLNGSFITKTRFNEVNAELKNAKAAVAERDAQLETLKNCEAHSSVILSRVDDNLFRKLAFVRSKNEFEGTEEGGYEYLLIKPVEMHPSLKGDPAKVFTCEHGGKVQLSFAAWLQAPDLSKTGTGIAVYQNGKKIWPEDEDYYKVPGTLTIKRITVDAAKGDDLAIVLDCINDNNSFDATNVRVCAKYLSSNDSERTEWPDYPEETLPQQSDQPGGTTPTEPDVQPSEQTEEPQPETQTLATEEGGEGTQKRTFPLVMGITGGALVLACAAAAAVWLLKKRKQN